MSQIQSPPSSPPYALRVASLPTSSPVSQLTPEATIGWRTYRNEEYSFEVKYPPDWKEDSEDPNYYQGIFAFSLTSPQMVKECKSGLTFLCGHSITIRVLDVPSFSELDKELDRQIRESGYNFIGPRKRMKINGYDAYTMSVVGEGSYLYIYFEKNNQVYNIIFWTTHTLDRLTPTLGSILSTFRFLD